MTEISETEIKSMTKEQNYMRGYRDGKSDVLDKIRADILEKCFDVPYNNQAFDYGLKIVKWGDVHKILDKYKVESEE